MRGIIRMNNIDSVIADGLKTTFVDSSVTTSIEYKPQLLTNDYSNGKSNSECVQGG